MLNTHQCGLNEAGGSTQGHDCNRSHSCDGTYNYLLLYSHSAFLFLATGASASHDLDLAGYPKPSFLKGLGQYSLVWIGLLFPADLNHGA